MAATVEVTNMPPAVAVTKTVAEAEWTTVVVRRPRSVGPRDGHSAVLAAVAVVGGVHDVRNPWSPLNQVTSAVRVVGSTLQTPPRDVVAVRRLPKASNNNGNRRTGVCALGVTGVPVHVPAEEVPLDEVSASAEGVPLGAEPVEEVSVGEVSAEEEPVEEVSVEEVSAEEVSAEEVSVEEVPVGASVQRALLERISQLEEPQRVAGTQRGNQLHVQPQATVPPHVLTAPLIVLVLARSEHTHIDLKDDVIHVVPTSLRTPVGLAGGAEPPSKGKSTLQQLGEWFYGSTETPPGPPLSTPKSAKSVPKIARRSASAAQAGQPGAPTRTRGGTPLHGLRTLLEQDIDRLRQSSTLTKTDSNRLADLQTRLNQFDDTEARTLRARNRSGIVARAAGNPPNADGYSTPLSSSTPLYRSTPCQSASAASTPSFGSPVGAGAAAADSLAASPFSGGTPGSGAKEDAAMSSGDSPSSFSPGMTRNVEAAAAAAAELKSTPAPPASPQHPPPPQQQPQQQPLRQPQSKGGHASYLRAQEATETLAKFKLDLATYGAVEGLATDAAIKGHSEAQHAVAFQTELNRRYQTWSAGTQRCQAEIDAALRVIGSARQNEFAPDSLEYKNWYATNQPPQNERSSCNGCEHASGMQFGFFFFILFFICTCPCALVTTSTCFAFQLNNDR